MLGTNIANACRLDFGWPARHTQLHHEHVGCHFLPVLAPWWPPIASTRAQAQEAFFRHGYLWCYRALSGNTLIQNWKSKMFFNVGALKRFGKNA